MADFVAVLKKTIEGLPDNSPEMRQKVYAKARDTVKAKLAAISPAPSQIAVDRQLKALEDAIGVVERSFDPISEADDFDSVLAELQRREPSGAPAKPATAMQPAEPAIADEAAPADDTDDADDVEAGAVSEDPVPPATVAATPASVGRLGLPPELEPRNDVDGLVEAEATPRPLPKLPRATSPDGGPADAEKSETSEISGASEAVVAAPATAPEEESVSPSYTAPARERRGVSGMLVAALIALVVVGGAGYGVWLNRDAFADMFGMGSTVVATDPAPDAPEAEEPAVVAEEEPAPEPEDEVEIAAVDPQPEAPAPAAPAAPVVEKFTQRLNPDGTETDEGPAGGTGGIGEGTSLAAATETGNVATDAQPAGAGNATGQAAALPVGQRAIFYEERTSLAEGTADEGAAVWSLVQESPGGDAPPEPAIRGEVTIPSRDLQIRMTIRRNADASLPASHIVEMIFITSGTFEGGGVENVLRMAFKSSEAAAGAPLIGIPAKIADGYFLVALSDNERERNANLQLMARENWIDIPIAYRSGRRALVTMEKGIPGTKVFQDAIRAWQAASSG